MEVIVVSLDRLIQYGVLKELLGTGLKAHIQVCGIIRTSIIQGQNKVPLLVKELFLEEEIVFITRVKGSIVQLYTVSAQGNDLLREIFELGPAPAVTVDTKATRLEKVSHSIHVLYSRSQSI